MVPAGSRADARRGPGRPGEGESAGPSDRAVAALRRDVAAAARRSPRSSPLATAAGLVRVAAEAGGWTPPTGLRVTGVAPAPASLDVGVPADLATTCGPELLGTLYEAALAPGARDAGAHYTPSDVAARVVGLIAGPAADLGAAPRVWDPACGGGAFLLAAADALRARGVAAEVIVGELLWGTDVDPGAIAVAEAALAWWAHRHGATATTGEHLTVADPLIDVVPPRPRRDHAERSARHPLGVAAAAGFDLVVGNPPFQGQLTGPSVRSVSARAALRARWGSEVVRPYTDTASLFLVAAARALAPGGRLALVLPSSVLAARDAAPARAAAETVGLLTDLWVAAEPVFEAEVQVCAVVVERPGEPDRVSEPDRPAGGGVASTVTTGTAAGPGASATGVEPTRADRADRADRSERAVGGGSSAVRRWRGRSFVSLAPASPGSVVRAMATERGDGWAALALAALGVPDPGARFDGRLGSIAVGRAGFRDEYYGLVGHVAEGPEGDGGPGDLPDGLAALVTSGLVDPGRCAWGERPASFGRTRYRRPVVDLVSLATAGNRASSWVGSLSVAKVVVATQTKVGEAAVDEAGRWVASTPTIAVVADPARLWEVAAIVCSPLGTVAALAATAGTARAGDAIRHTVASVGGLPLPIDHDAWRAGAAALRRQDRAAFVAAMAAAYAVDDSAELDDWWQARAPWPT